MIAKLKTYIFIIFVLIITANYNLFAAEMFESDCEKYVKEIVHDFVAEMNDKYNFLCAGINGRITVENEQIHVMFGCFRCMSVDEVRKIEVKSILSLLNRINNHEKLKPYLKEHPFNINRIGLSIGFRTEKNNRPLDGSAVVVIFYDGIITYRAAEIQMVGPSTDTYTNELNEIVTEFVAGGQQEVLIPLHEETFEEALKIVSSAS